MICIDPGLRGCGAALFHEQKLIEARYISNPEKTRRGPVAWRAMADAIMNTWGWMGPVTSDMYLEVPQVYGGPRAEDPNDLIDLAGVDGAIASRYASSNLNFFLPRQWKGQVPKDKMTQRIKEQLFDFELARVKSAGAKDHNTYDAIGIGLFVLGRLEKRRGP